MKIRPARPHDAPELSGLAMRSKAHWGYGEDFMQRCREELQILGADCDGTRVKLAETGNRLVGFYRISGTGGAGRLDALFVEPHYIGHGAGKLLLSDARTTARGLGMRSLTLDSDPHAASFYDRMGAIRTGEAASGSIKGRVLPQYRFELAD